MPSKQFIKRRQNNSQHSDLRLFYLNQALSLSGEDRETFELLQQLRQDVTRVNNLYYNTGYEMVGRYVNGCLARIDSILCGCKPGYVLRALF
jgi:surface polysaccharide O-acyltransferase-like enzyme